MSEFASSYTSTNVEDGMTFDVLIEKLLAYKPEQWGYTEQDFNKINSDFGVDSNNLYYLPSGNYKMENLPNSPFNSDFVNVNVYTQDSKKIIFCDIGGKDRYYVELSSVSDTISWTDITNFGGDGNKLILFYVGEKSPSDTSMIWIDTSKLKSDDLVSLKYYNGTSWVSYSANGVMLQDVYDTQKLKKDPYATVISSLEAYVGDYTNFIKHKNNELTLIHLAKDEREYLDVYLLTTEQVQNYFKVNGDLYNKLLEYIKSKSAELTKCDINGNVIADINDEYTTHIDGYKIDKVYAGSVTASGETDLHDICYGNGVCVAVGKTFKYSLDDGITWLDGIHSITGKPITNSTSSCVCYGNGVFIATPGGSGSHLFYRSTDGITWTPIVISNPNTWLVVNYAICYDDTIKRFIALPFNKNVLLASIDGTEWRVTEKNITNAGWRSLCCRNDAYVGVGDNNKFIYISINTNEIIEGTISSTNRDWYSVCYGNGKFVAISWNGSVAYSTDGINWTEATISNSSKYWSSVCYGNGKFAAVADNNIFAYSTDGINWTVNNAVNHDESIEIVYCGDPSVCYGNGKYFMRFSDNNIDCIYTCTDINPHITSAQVSSWNNKAEKDHTHNLDGKVTIRGEDIKGVDGKTISSDILGTEYYERIHKIDSISIFESGISTSDLNDKYHDGNTVYIENANGSEEWWKIVDNTKFNTANYMDGLKLLSSTNESPNFSDILNKPTTLEGYGITNGVTLETFEETKNDVDTELSYDVTLFSKDDYNNLFNNLSGIGISIQKTLNENGGGTELYPMTTATSDLDIAVGVQSTTNTDLPTVKKINCERGTIQIGDWTEGIISSSRPWHSVCYGNDKFVAVGSSSYSTIFAYSTDGITWTEGNISSTSRYWRSVCYGNGKFVAIANDSKIFAYSTDGITWTEGNISSTSRYWDSVCYGNGKYVAVSDGSNIFAYSTDGVTWTEGTISSTNRDWYSVCYGNGKYVAVSYTQYINVFAYSTDGITWTEVNIGSTDECNWDSVCYGNGKYVAVAANTSTFAYSTDGITWTEGNIGYRNWQSVCYGNGKFIAIAYNSNVFAYSTDGITWTEGNISSSQWTSICYGNGKFVAVSVNVFAYMRSPLDYPKVDAGISIFNTDYAAIGYFNTEYANDSDNPKWTSDGLGKVIKHSTIPADNILYEDKYTINSETYHIAILYDVTKGIIARVRLDRFTNGMDNCTDLIIQNEDEIVYRVDSLARRLHENGAPIVVNTWERLPSTRYREAVCYGNGKFIAITAYSSTFAYSTDGVTWTEGTIGYRYWDSVCYGNGKFIAVGQQTNIFAYSTDGITWTEGTISNTNRYWDSVCYGNGKFVAITGNSNIFAYSTDGITWTESTISSAERNWRSICYGNGKFVAVAQICDIILYSTDGITWTESTISSAERNWNSVCYGNGKFVAVSFPLNNINKFAYSTDGITWTEGNISNTSRYWYFVCYGNGKFVAKTNNDDIFAYSTDGITWTEGNISDNTNREWYSMCYGNGKFVLITYSTNVFAVIY